MGVLEAPGSQEFRSLKALFFHSDDMARFDFGIDHPMKPERVLKTVELCRRYGLMDHPWMCIVPPTPADPELLTLFHDQAYLAILEEASQATEVRLEMLERGIGTRDNPIIPGIFQWSLKVVGATHLAMERLVAGDAVKAFNPYGGLHHGMPDHAEGFCYVNDIAIAIKDALSKGKKVAYVDCDAHHGNGVQEAFWRDARALVISLHETGRTLYPWSGWETEIGEGEGVGFTVNVPLEPGTDDEVYSFAFESVVLPLLDAFSPDILVAQIGADTLISDPLTHLRLTNNGYQRALRGMVGRCNRILALGGGGYDLYRTARCWTLAWGILNDLEPKDELAGLVGGMMFGPEMEVGSLYDYPYLTEGEAKERAWEEADRVVRYIRDNVFPIHGIR